MIANIMSLHSANVPLAGTLTGLPSGPTPPISDETSSALNEASQKDPTRQTVPGKDQQDNNEEQVMVSEAGKPKTAKESMEDPAEPP